MTRPFLAIVLTAALGASACTGGSGSETAGSDSTATTTGAVPDSDTASSEPPATEISDTTTSTSSSTTTTLPPAPMAALTSAVLPSPARELSDDGVYGMVVLDGDGPRAVMAGVRADAGGAQPRAAAYVYSGPQRMVTVPLSSGEAVQSTAYDITGTADLLVASGVSVDDEGHPRAALWRSTDRGTSWTDAEHPLDDRASSAVAATVMDGAILLIARVDTVRGYDMVTARETVDGWDVSPFGAEQDVVSIARIMADGDTVVVTGNFEDGERTSGAVWTSVDRGATFTFVVDAVIAESANIGEPALGGDRFIAMSARPNDQPLSIVTSADGLAWRSIDLNVVDGDGDAKGMISDAGQVIEHDGRFVFGYDDIRGGIAIVDQDGTGTSFLTLDERRDVYAIPVPFVFAGVLHTIANSRSSFRVARLGSGDLWRGHAKPDGGWFGAAPSGVILHEFGDTVRALSYAYPDIEQRDDGGFNYGSAPQWVNRDGAAWVDDPSLDASVRLVGSNGVTSVAFSTVDDPGDDEIAGRIGGTGVAYQMPDGTWTDPDLLLTGPGGDSAADVAALSDGLVMVGDRSNRDELGVSSESIVLMEYTDGGEWIDRAVGVVTPERAELYGVTTTAHDVALAGGWQLVDDIWKPMLLARSASGAWTETTLPTDATDLDVFDAVADDDTIAVLSNENADSWVLYTTTDGLDFDRVPISFDSDLTVQPSRLAQIDGRSYLVGTTTSVDMVVGIGLWEVGADGATTQIEVDAGPAALHFEISDVAVDGGDILVGGIGLGQNVVWTITPPAP